MKSKEKIIKIMGVLLFGGFLALFNETIVNVALPKLMEELNVSAQTIQWLSTGYLLVIGILVPVTAFLIQKFTLKKLYLSAMILCLVGTIIAAIAPSFYVLLLGRLVQATGTGMLVPIMMTTIVVINPPKKRGAAVGLGLFVILFAPSIAPTISGIIIQVLSWRYLFIIEIPLILIAIICGNKFLEEVSECTNPRIDIISIIFSTLGFGGIIMGFSLLGNKSCLVFFIIGAIALAFFSRRQFKLDEPMLDIKVLRNKKYSIGVIFIMMSMMTLFETLVVIPMYLEGMYNLTPLQVGIAIFPAGLINAITSIITGNIYDKFGAKNVVRIGFLILTVCFFMLSRVSANTNYINIIIILCILNIGMPFVMTSSQTNSLNQLKPKEYPHGTAIINTIQQISAAMGSSLFVSLMVMKRDSYLSLLENVSEDNMALAFSKGFSYTFFVGAVILLIGLISSIVFFGDKDNKVYEAELE